MWVRVLLGGPNESLIQLEVVFMKYFLKFTVLTITVTLLLCACSVTNNEQCISKNSSPIQVTNNLDTASSPCLFECVYTNEEDYPSVNDCIFYIYRFIPNDTLFLVRSNYGGVTQMFNDYNKAVPAHYANDLKPYLNP